MVRAEQFIKFALVGCVAAIANYGSFWLLYTVLGMYYIVGAALGFVAGVFAGYGLNKAWTFRVGGREGKRYLKSYFLVYTASLVVGMGVLHILVDWMGIMAEISNVLVIGVTTVTNFIGLKFWVFAEGKA